MGWVGVIAVAFGVFSVVVAMIPMRRVSFADATNEELLSLERFLALRRRGTAAIVRTAPVLLISLLVITMLPALSVIWRYVSTMDLIAVAFAETALVVCRLIVDRRLATRTNDIAALLAEHGRSADRTK